VEITKPSGQIVVNDRLVDVVSDKSMAEVINKAPIEKQPELIREWIASKERLATQILNNEDKRNTGFWAGLLEVLKIVAPAGLGYLIAK
jgi:hypothetical protein